MIQAHAPVSSLPTAGRPSAASPVVQTEVIQTVHQVGTYHSIRMTGTSAAVAFRIYPAFQVQLAALVVVFGILGGAEFVQKRHPDLFQSVVLDTFCHPDCINQGVVLHTLMVLPVGQVV